MYDEYGLTRAEEKKKCDSVSQYVSVGPLSFYIKLLAIEEDNVSGTLNVL